MERLHGLFKAAYLRNGKRWVLSYGSMVNVSIPSTFFLSRPDYRSLRNVLAGAGKSILWYVMNENII